MQLRYRTSFTTLRTEGAILPADLLQRIAGGYRNLAGLTPEDYHLDKGERLNEATNRAWNRLVGAWATFREARQKLPPQDLGTTVTRERWLLPLFSELGYGRLLTAKAIDIAGKSYPISHGWQHTPMHLVGCRVELDTRAAGVAGASRSSPHGLVQELLNRSDEHLWGFVANGLRLRILRDNSSLTRQAYVEFDLEAMMEGEVYADFVLLWLLCHESRVEAERSEECWLERWSRAAQEQGTRALEQLRIGVEEAITALGRGFLTHTANQALRDKLRSGALNTQEYYRQLLRLVYRLLFLFVAEDRELLLDPQAEEVARDRYQRFYSTAKLRRLAERRLGTRHADLYHGLRLIMEKLGSDAGCPELGLPALGSFLFSVEAVVELEGCEISNHDLLDAIRVLALSNDGHSRRLVDYKNLGSEELGSVYESLLELHPLLNVDAGTFELKTAGGHERKTTGSYYTPTSLIQCLLDSALDPVIEDRLKEAREAEQALLALKICDPACGSGHFLIAAAHRVAKRLAAVRTGDEEPSPEAIRTALRDVIGHCIYGVDLNPMAVELCKVSLWMEALEPGKPLSFLDHRIQCGNSLLGATPALLIQGIPDEAFDPIEGDDKEVCKKFRKQNKEERGEGKVKPGEGRVRGQMPLFDAADQPWQRLGDLATGLLSVEQIPDDTIEGIRRKQERYEELVRSSGYLYGRLWADAWCAAFVWKKTAEFPYPITEEAFRRIERNPFSVAPWMRDEIQRLAQEYQFFHWHLAFPDAFQLAASQGVGEEVSKHMDPSSLPPSSAGWSGGFDVVLGNPPWDQLQFREQEFFATGYEDIAQAGKGATRKRLINELKKTNPATYQAFISARRTADGARTLVQNNGAYPFTGRGRSNTFALFCELNTRIVSTTGRVGCVVPSGVATDDTTKFFFQHLVARRLLVSLFDFENREGLFPSVDSRAKFCLLTMTGSGRPLVSEAEFVFFAQKVEDLRDLERRVALSLSDFALLNPNTRTAVIFRTKRDASITTSIYRRVPVLLRDDTEDGNIWGIVTKPGLFNMTGDSELFQTRDQLEKDAWELDGNIFRTDSKEFVPLYEGKMFDFFDHRAAGVKISTTAALRQGQPDELSSEEHGSPSIFPIPRYWVSTDEVDRRLATQWDRNWILGWKEVTSSTNERTLIPGLLPRFGIGHKIPIALPKAELELLVPCFLGCLSSFVCDYVAWQKLGTTSLTPFTFKQLPILPPFQYQPCCIWSSCQLTKDWITVRIVELCYTAWDLEPFAQDCGYDGPPFLWDEQRRFLLRCELDAAYFHLYDITRDDVDHIMQTFPIVKRKDEQKHGEYRTKRVILEIYDAMAEAMRTGTPYQTLLDPPPADLRVAHPPRQAAAV